MDKTESTNRIETRYRGKAAIMTTCRPVLQQMVGNWQLYLLMLLPLLYILIFHYYPMYGLQIAFKKYEIAKGISGSEWVGFVHFKRFFHSYDFHLVFGNTLKISMYQLLVGFPAPVVLALSLNYIMRARFKKALQMATYAPHFISVVVMSGILVQLLSHTGAISKLVEMITGERINFLGEAALFKTIFVFSGVWQNIGWSSIIYLAALSSIDPTLHEAAVMDGASKWKRIRHIDVPGIMPTIVVLLILEIGKVMNIGYQKILLLQNPLNLSSSEVIDTYVYKVGIISGLPNFSYAAAIGLLKSVIGLVLIYLANRIAKKVNNNGLW
jgi:putative aldouronate transport system permease protein